MKEYNHPVLKTGLEEIIVILTNKILHLKIYWYP